MMKLIFIENKEAGVFATVDSNRPPVEADFYRFTPSAGMSDREIATIRSYLESLRAGSVVKVLPRERKTKTVAKSKVKRTKAKQPREVVNSLVDTSTSKDKASLKEECQNRMDECNV